MFKLLLMEEAGILNTKTFDVAILAGNPEHIYSALPCFA